MKRSFLIVIVSTALFISCLSPAQQKLQEGDAYLAKQDWDQAIVSYSLAGELDPQLKPAGKIAAAYAGKASSSYKNADYESAVFNFNKAAAFDPQIKADFDLGYACYMSGLSDLEKGRYQEARQMLGEAIAHGYARPEAYLARAQAYNKLGMYSGAIGDATACLDIDPAAAGAYSERGFAYLAAGEYQKAIADLSQSIALGSSFKDVYYSRGLAYGWRNHNIEYNLCCGSRAVSGYVLDRCNRLLSDYFGGQSIPFEKDALYFGTDQDRVYW